MGKVRQSGLHEQEWPADINVVHVSERLRALVLDDFIGGNACVVDYNVELELARFGMSKVVKGCGHDVGGSIDGTHVCLNRESFDAVGGLQLAG